MRIAITGATGNIGTSCLEVLGEEPRVDQIVGIARRAPEASFRKARFVELDVAGGALERYFENADAVIHLAWDVRPSHSRTRLWRNNVEGSARVFEAAVRSGVRTLIHASSIGVYAAAPGRQVDESWPHDGISQSSYSTQKAAVEARLDRLEALHPALRIVRMRPAFVFKGEAASGIQRLFLGSLVPGFVFRPGAVPFIPSWLELQCVHSLDVAEAVRLLVLGDVKGAFNLAAPPPLDARALARILKSRALPIPAAALRPLVEALWTLRIQPSEPGWMDLAVNAPLISSERARRELGWQPRRGAEETLLELLDGLRHGKGLDTPRLRPRSAKAAQGVRAGRRVRPIDVSSRSRVSAHGRLRSSS